MFSVLFFVEVRESFDHFFRVKRTREQIVRAALHQPTITIIEVGLHVVESDRSERIEHVQERAQRRTDSAILII